MANVLSPSPTLTAGIALALLMVTFAIRAIRYAAR